MMSHRVSLQRYSPTIFSMQSSSSAIEVVIVVLQMSISEQAELRSVAHLVVKKKPVVVVKPEVMPGKHICGDKRIQ